MTQQELTNEILRLAGERAREETSRILRELASRETRGAYAILHNAQQLAFVEGAKLAMGLTKESGDV